MNNIVQTKTTYHVTLSEAKKHLNIETSFTDDDDYITQLIKEATSNAENYIDGDIALTSNVYTLYDFGGSVITIDSSPLISVSAISYLDDDGNAQAIDPDDTDVARIQKGWQKFIIRLESAISTTDELTVTFTSGYTTASDCPEALKRAVLLQIGDWFDVQRGSLTSKAFNDSDAFYRTLNFYKKSSY